MELDEGDLAQIVGASKHNLTYEQLFPPADPLTIDQAEVEKERLIKNPSKVESGLTWD